MHDSPLREAHRRVLQRIAAHRVAAARQAEAARGPDDRRGGLAAVAELETAPWGVIGEGGGPACEVVLDYGELEAEYAALRRGTAIVDRVDRTVVELTGSDATDLVDRLVTNAVGTAPSAVVPAFLLDRTGRIQADVRVVTAADRTLLELDRTDAAAVAAAFEGMIFAEDCTVVDRSHDLHRLDVIGPEAPATIEHLTGSGLPAGGTRLAVIDDVSVTLFALDGGRGAEVDVPGIAVLAAADAIERVWEAILARPAPGRRPARAVGWNALNIARIEAGTPMFHLDFGPDALPHETGLVDRRVDFRKGCYPGQEVVARLQSRAGGRGRRRVTGLRFDEDALPVAGAQVFDLESGVGDQVGVVTSSTVSPMRGAAPIAFATMRASHMDPGARVLVNAEGRSVPATVTGLDLEVAAPESSEPHSTEPDSAEPGS